MSACMLDKLPTGIPKYFPSSDPDWVPGFDFGSEIGPSY